LPVWAGYTVKPVFVDFYQKSVADLISGGRFLMIIMGSTEFIGFSSFAFGFFFALMFYI
jgi:hypothetical protein